MPLDHGGSGGAVSHVPIELEIQNLNTTTPGRSDENRITSGPTQDGKADANAINVTLEARPGQLTNTVSVGSTRVTADVNLSEYSITLIAAPANLVTVTESETNKRFVTLSLTGTATVTLTAVSGRGSVTGTKATLTSKDVKLALNTGSPTPLNVYSATANVTVDPNSKNTVILTLKSIKAEGIITHSPDTTITQVIVTIPVNITVSSETISSVVLILPVPSATGQNNLTMPTYSGGTLTIDVTAAQTGGSGSATVQTVTGKGFYPKFEGHCIYSVRDTDKDIWANIGGKCEYVACYKGSTSTGKTSAILILYFRSGGSPERKYFGTENAGTSNTEWKTIPNEDDFIQKLPALANNERLNLQGNEFKAIDQYNRDFDNIRLSPVWFLYKFVSLFHKDPLY